MLSDTKWGGSGAGSFEALLPIYRDSNEVDSFEIPTAAATIAIEMGQPFLWACVVVFLMAAATLFRRALLRGRDYVYSSAGAGCIIALLVLLFANDGILGLPASLMIGVLCGLAFAQSKSASNRDLGLSEELYSIPIRTNDRPTAGVSR
jgi:ABC-type arginine transport system permease subunit